LRGTSLMLKSILRSTLGRLIGRATLQKKTLDLAERVGLAVEKREWQAAIDFLRQMIEVEPRNVAAHLRLGIYLQEIGEKQEAFKSFELAHRLDDSNMEVAVNYAQCLAEGGHITEAIDSLARAQLVIPDYPFINSIYASLQFRMGKTDAAQKFSLRAWLAYFDNSRIPDSFLWHSAYVDQPESVLASEHHFWAGTCSPLSNEIKHSLRTFGPVGERKKLRVGYWSPDFKDHSVRYFFRPLLEGHDRNNVELFLYHDSSSSDRQTDEIKAHADHFHVVHKNTDEEIVRLIASHNLDILVELAGHTSHNRLWLLQERLARVQLTGLGYPPTTGLSTIDGKFVDPHIQSDAESSYYAERQLVLPESFWCFDPRGDAPLPSEPPVLKKGHITFGCFGNVSKINKKMIAAWAEIMRRVPRSRLLLRSVNFNSAETVSYFEGLLAAAGIHRSRFDLLGPVSSVEFFKSYNELDIVLDTHPFNGGTTTCFAVYMGVPVVTLVGESLISRMGKSVVNNVGAGDLAVSDIKQYISKAVSISQDINFLKKFRSEARERFKSGSLGDGKKFANELERIYNSLARQGVDGYVPKIFPLPPQELVRRAGAVLSYGNWNAAKRIVDYCLLYYPDFAAAHIMATEEMTKDGYFSQAVTYLLSVLPRFHILEHCGVLINVIRFQILSNDLSGAAGSLESLESSSITDTRDQLQLILFKAVLGPPVPLSDQRGQHDIRKIKCIIPCDDIDLYERILRQMPPAPLGYSGLIEFFRCREDEKSAEYRRILRADDSDIVIFLQKNIQIYNEMVWTELAGALGSCDVVGFSGAKRWNRFDWRLDDFDQRACGYTMPLNEKAEFSELRIAGPGLNKVALGMAVLEGGFLAVNAKRVAQVPFTEDLMDADGLFEEQWSYQAGLAGARIAVHRQLGIHITNDVELNKTYLATARSALVRHMGFDVFSLERNDGSFVSSPVQTPSLGLAAVRAYLSA